MPKLRPKPPKYACPVVLPPLHFTSTVTESGCLLSISLRLSSSCTPSVGRRRFYNGKGTKRTRTPSIFLFLPQAAAATHCKFARQSTNPEAWPFLLSCEKASAPCMWDILLGKSNLFPTSPTCREQSPEGQQTMER